MTNAFKYGFAFAFGGTLAYNLASVLLAALVHGLVG